MTSVKHLACAAAIAAVSLTGLGIGSAAAVAGGKLSKNAPSAAFDPALHRQGERCAKSGRHGVWVVDDSQAPHRWVCGTNNGLPAFKPNAHEKGDPCTSRGRAGGWMPIDTGHGWEWVCYTDR